MELEEIHTKLSIAVSKLEQLLANPEDDEAIDEFIDAIEDAFAKYAQLCLEGCDWEEGLQLIDEMIKKILER